MEFNCMFCGRKHHRPDGWVDERFLCSCGHELFVFYNEGLTVVLPSDDIRSDAAIQAFRYFVISTGRCRDAATVRASFAQLFQTSDPMGLMEVGLERFQYGTYGKCYLNCGDVASICESLKDHKDVMIRNKGISVDIYEMQQRKKGKMAS